MFGDKRVEKKKTPIYKCNLNPIFNASFEFDVPWEQIRDCAIDVQVMDFDTIGRNELIGKILLACKYYYFHFFLLKKYIVCTYLRFLWKKSLQNNDVLVIDILTKKSMLFFKKSTYIISSLTTSSYIFKKCFPAFKAINHHFLTLYVRNFQKLHFFYFTKSI